MTLRGKMEQRERRWKEEVRLIMGDERKGGPIKIGWLCKWG